MAARPQVVSFEEGWQFIKTRLFDPLVNFLLEESTGNTSIVSSEAYQTATRYSYKLCTQMQEDCHVIELYTHCKMAVAEYLQTRVVPRLRDCTSEDLLRAVGKSWEDQKIMNKWMSLVFSCIDRYHPHKYLPGQVPGEDEKYLCVKDIGIHAFSSFVLLGDFGENKDMKLKMNNTILYQIALERSGEVIDRQLLKSCIELYVAVSLDKEALEVYEAFEIPFLEQTAKYYRNKSQILLGEDPISVYALKIELILEEESSRAKTYLHNSTECRLLRVVEIETIQNHIGEFLDREGSGFRVMLLNDQFGDLKRLFNLFKRINLENLTDINTEISLGLRNSDCEPLQLMAKVFQDHILKLGEAKINDRKSKHVTCKSADERDSVDIQFVADVISIQDKYLGLVSDIFETNRAFVTAYRYALAEIVNKNVFIDSQKSIPLKTQIPQCLSLYCDSLLKSGGNKTDTIDEQDQILDSVVKLVACLQDKDVFIEFYRHNLARRLLNGRSESIDAEKSMISKLAVLQGPQFTTKLEGMLFDLTFSVEQSEFNEFCRNQTIGGNAGLASSIDFSVKVLTHANWPTYREVQCILPPSMQMIADVYNTFFIDKQSGRKLSWYHSLGNVELRALLGKKVYTLQLTTLQAVILCSFEGEACAKSFSRLVEETGIGEDVVNKILHSFTFMKYKILNRQSELDVVGGVTEDAVVKKRPEIKHSDVFSLNDAFRNSVTKFRIPMASIDEVSTSTQKIHEDRSYAIEASIVRVMKTRREYEHSKLVGEVLSQLNQFKPESRQIKKIIDSLIEREYLERVVNNPNTYRYLA